MTSESIFYLTGRVQTDEVSEGGPGQNVMRVKQRLPCALAVGSGSQARCMAVSVAGDVNNVSGVGVEVKLSNGALVRHYLPDSFCPDIHKLVALLNQHCGHFLSFTFSQESNQLTIGLRTPSERKEKAEKTPLPAAFFLSPALAAITGMDSNNSYKEVVETGIFDIFAVVRQVSVFCPHTAEASMVCFDDRQAKSLGVVELHFDPDTGRVRNSRLLTSTPSLLLPAILHHLSFALHSLAVPGQVVTSKRGMVTFCISLIH